MAITTMPLGVTAVMLPELDFDEQLSLCKKLGVTHYCFRPRVIPDDQKDKPYSNWGSHKFDLTPQRLLQEAQSLRQRVLDAGLTPFGTVPATTIEREDEELRLHIEGAAAVGAGRVRMGPYPYPQTPFNYAQLLDKTVQRYRYIIDTMARPLGVKLVIEMHARTMATSPGLAWNIVRHFSPAEIGVIFDIPNFSIEGNVNPLLGVAVVRDYIDHCHVGGTRRITTGYDSLGFRQGYVTMCPVTECDLHVPTWIGVLRDYGVSVPLLIEDYTPNKPGAWRLTDSATALRRLLDSL